MRDDFARMHSSRGDLLWDYEGQTMPLNEFGGISMNRMTVEQFDTLLRQMSANDAQWAQHLRTEKRWQDLYTFLNCIEYL